MTIISVRKKESGTAILGNARAISTELCVAE
jgi:hypothetical protein